MEQASVPAQPSPTGFPDERERHLLAKILNGERDCFYELIAPYERRVYLTAYEILRNSADAEEVAQEAFLKAYRGLSKFRGEAKFSTWLLRITVNEARMRWRKVREVSLESLLPEDDETGYTPLQLADWREIPGDALDKREMREQISQALAALPEKYREILTLRDINGLSVAETAEALDLGISNVKTRLFRARMQLRDAFIALGQNKTQGKKETGRLR